MGFRFGYWKGPFGVTFGKSGPRAYMRGGQGWGCVVLLAIGAGLIVRLLLAL